MHTLFEEIQSNLEEINEGVLSKLKAYGHKRRLKNIKRLSDAGVRDDDLVYSSKTLGEVYAEERGPASNKSIEFSSYVPWPNQTDDVLIYYPQPGTKYSWKDAEKAVATLKKNQSRMISLAEAEYNVPLKKTSVVISIMILEDKATVVFEDTRDGGEFFVTIEFATRKLKLHYS